MWHDVGIVPTVEIAGERRSDSSIRLEKSILLHRFNYLVLKDTIRLSHVGLIVSGRLVYPRSGLNSL